MIDVDKVRVTVSAVNGAHELGINDLAGMSTVVMSLTGADFCEYMTTHADRRIWQDAYHVKTIDRIDVDLKLTVVDDALIVSFKEL